MAPSGGTARLRVLRPGPCSLVVDLGRPDQRGRGVPVGGAADRASLRLGNALLGTPPESAAVEFALAGPSVQADADLACVVFGAPFDLHSDRQRLRMGCTFTLTAGEVLDIGASPVGGRAYLCVAGGIEAARVLGSRSALALLRAGDELPCHPGRTGVRFTRPPWPGPPTDPEVLHVVDGAQATSLDGARFYRQTFAVMPASNRMGLRLEGEPLSVAAAEMVSEPVCPGTVQVTRDGRCIVLGVDGQTIGGYPKIAQVIAADLDRLGQLGPGRRVRFERVSLEEATARFRRREESLREWTIRLLTAADAVR